MKEPSKLQQRELDALLLDRSAVLEIVSALREYRAIVAHVLSHRWGDGAIDGAISSRLHRGAEEIEDLEHPAPRPLFNEDGAK